MFDETPKTFVPAAQMRVRFDCCAESCPSGEEPDALVLQHTAHRIAHAAVRVRFDQAQLAQSLETPSDTSHGHPQDEGKFTRIEEWMIGE